MERREAKTDSLKIANEERRLRNKIMRKTMLEDSGADRQAAADIGNENAPLPKTGVHPWLWVAGVLLVVGVIYRRSR